MGADRLVAIDDDAGLFAADRWSRAGWHWRMTAVALDGGGLALLSPIRRLPDGVHEELAARGGARVLVAPNHFHYLGLAEYLERYPEAEAVCSDQARLRLARRTSHAYVEVDRLAAALPAHVEVLSPPAMRSGEIWLRVETARGVAWVVSDAFFNVADHPTGMTGLICRLTQTTAGLRIGRTFTTLQVRTKRAYRDWLLARIEEDKPRILVPAHGEILESDALAEQLAALAAARL